jgi:DtxR family Mn-dependent transcriptional regulator
VLRRHRLAERLLSDVLSAHESVMHEKACRFEHLLDRGLEENICTLLGHPKICPHGKPIPPGRCCQQKGDRPWSVVFPLAQLRAGQRAKIAYLYAPESSRLHKLLSMGLLPGAPVRLVQTFPSYVFELGHAQFAVDEEIAGAIYVRPVEAERGDELGTPARTGTGRRLWLRLRRGS